MDGSESSQLSIMLVDDSADDAFAMTKLLNQLGHQVVAHATNGAEAVSLVKVLAPDLILLDAHMPGPDGVTSDDAGAETAKAILAIHPVPLILISAHSAMAVTQKASEAGVMASLLKPVSKDQLFRTINLANARFGDLEQLRLINQQLLDEVERRKRAEKAMADSEQQYRTLTENMPDIVLRFDLDLRHIYVSPNVERLGGSVDYLLGKTHLESCLHEDAQLVHDTIRQVRDQKEMRELEFSYAIPESDEVVLSMRLVPELDADGEVTAILGVCRDVTSIRQAYAALLRSQQQAALGLFATGIAHQFNNLNMVIGGSVELLLKEPSLAESQRQRLEEVASAVQRGTAIINQLIKYSKDTDLHTQRVSVRELIDMALDDQRAQLTAENVSLAVSCPAKIMVDADIAQMANALNHLFINARHAMLGRPNKRLEIIVEQPGSDVLILVTDTGTGIDAKHLNKIFLPFYSTKGEHATRGSKQASLTATGLGLTVVDNIAKNHGGSLSVLESNPAGTVFKLALPAGKANSLEDTETRNKTHVLVVDDEPLVSELLVSILDEGGYKTIYAADGNEGLRMCDEQKVDLILLDMNMPGMNGAQFLEALHTSRDAGSIPPVIIMTGRAADEVHAAVDTYGVKSVLLKPFDYLSVLDSTAEALVDKDA